MTLMPALTRVALSAVLLLLLLLLLLSPARTDAAETKTSKERLTDKAADEQRVDNCRVPVERRGTTPRPDCAAQSSAQPASDNTAIKTAPAR
jgi:hypothetical protein